MVALSVNFTYDGNGNQLTMSDVTGMSDMVVWEKNGRVSHVAVYMCTVDSQRWIIESSGSQNGPNISKEWNWYSHNYIVAGYIIPEPNK